MLARRIHPAAPHLRLMSNDDTDRRETPTDVAPAPPSGTEETTSPHASPGPIIPKAGKIPQLSEPIREASIDQLLRMYQSAQDREHDLLDPDGRLALLHDARANRMRAEIVAELSTAIDTLAGKPIQTLTARVSRVAEKLINVEAKNDEQDRQLVRLTEELSNLNSALTTIMLQQGYARPERRLLDGKTMLVAEDSEHLQRIIVRMAREHGANTLTAGSLDEARSVVAAAGRTPDLAIVDIKLGDDDGFEAVEWLETLGVPRSRCLLMTGHLSEVGTRRAEATGLRTLLKPFEFSDLLIAINDALAAPVRGDATA
jgi:CheY-like chemotaxis protein